MYEPWASGEKLTTISKEVCFDYVPVKREDRLIRVPIVKSVAGADLHIVSETQKNIYSEIEEELNQLISWEKGLAETLEIIEERMIRQALKRCGSIQAQAAKILGISRSNLQYKMKKYGMLV